MNLSRDDEAYFSKLAIFDMRPHKGLCKLVALATATAHVELLSNVFHRFGTFIKRTANRFVGDVMAYANDHSETPPVWARRFAEECAQAKSR